MSFWNELDELQQHRRRKQADAPTAQAAASAYRQALREIVSLTEDPQARQIALRALSAA